MTDFIKVPLSQLVPSKNNPRKSINSDSIQELAQSIATDGILQNIVVVKSKCKKPAYNIVSGNRRFAACKLLVEQGKFSENHMIPVQVLANANRKDLRRIVIVENIQREDMTILDEADAIAKLVKGKMPLDEISAQTGISVATIRKRIALSGLSDGSRAALSEGAISLSQAEALTVGTHEQQAAIVEEINSNLNRRYSHDEIKDGLTGEKPTLSMAMFDRDDYSGTLTQDLFGEEESTYFNDIEQFTILQDQAVENMASQHRKDGYWPVDIVRGFHCSMIAYREAEEDEKGAVVIHLHPSGRVQIFDRIVKLELNPEIEDSAATTTAKPKPTYSKPLCEYMAMHKSAAVQAELLKNPRIAKQVGIVQLTRYLKPHTCYSYFDDAVNTPLALERLYKQVIEFMAILGMDILTEEKHFNLFPRYGLSNASEIYTMLEAMTDDELDRLQTLLVTMTFGQENTSLDTNADSLFNKVATDLKVSMLDYWTPDEDFLNRRNTEQLKQIVKETQTGRLFGYASQPKKSDLVRKMTDYFAKLFLTKKPDEQDSVAANWLPGAMNFPAIDPDRVIDTQIDKDSDNVPVAA